MDNLSVKENFETGDLEERKWPGWFARMIKWIEQRIWSQISLRVNFLLNRVNDNKIEIFAEGNTDKDQDGNWRWIESSGELILQKRVNGAWVGIDKDTHI